jgi:hypothetical protein
MRMAIAMTMAIVIKKLVSITSSKKVYTYTPLLVTYNYFVPFRTNN